MKGSNVENGNKAGLGVSAARCEFSEVRCGTPLGFVIFCPFQPSVRYATLGFGVELRCSSFEFGVPEIPFNNTPAILNCRNGIGAPGRAN